ncbi:hypothetical protein WG66_002324 [Moniliophthora roreri]|nr:hypothetical protein WG66_002324 [Moniliophthora roreri]
MLELGSIFAFTVSTQRTKSSQKLATSSSKGNNLKLRTTTSKSRGSKSVRFTGFPTYTESETNPIEPMSNPYLSLNRKRAQRATGKDARTFITQTMHHYSSPDPSMSEVPYFSPPTSQVNTTHAQGNEHSLDQVPR